MVVLGVTGCIGAYKACEVLRELQKREVDVRVVMTGHATRFVSAMTFEALSGHPVFVEPGSGYLACGWLGKGRLAEVPDIVAAAMAVLKRRRSLDGLGVVVSAGPTVEDIDPVRFVSNRSSGRMGYRLAEAARDRGARVVLVSGPTSLPAPHGVQVVAVRSAEEMARAVTEHAAGAAVVVMAAAVSDYRPAAVAPHKIKKEAGPQRLDLVRTPDVLRSLGQDKAHRLLVGFAAETEAVRENARRKLRDKNLDLIVANDVGGDGIGFASEDNAAVLIDADGETELPRMTKRELAERIWDRIESLRAARREAPARDDAAETPRTHRIRK
jgi:phosphopantothenoylcysteine decarboxylase/phosphopantothenate--cysteine ligase